MTYRTKEDRDKADAESKAIILSLLTRLEHVTSIEDFLSVIRDGATFAKKEIAANESSSNG